MFCHSCKNQILYHVEGICPKCGGSVENPQKKKMGRPITKTPEERDAKYKQWFKDNAEHRRKYHREYARDKRNSRQGRFVVEHEGLYHRQSEWVNIGLAKVYTSDARARYAIRMIGKGTVVEL